MRPALIDFNTAFLFDVGLPQDSCEEVRAYPFSEFLSHLKRPSSICKDEVSNF